MNHTLFHYTFQVYPDVNSNKKLKVVKVVFMTENVM